MSYADVLYLSESEVDVYEELYAEVERLNGDVDPIPKSIITYFGQELAIRRNDGYLLNSLSIIHLGKNVLNFTPHDSYTNYPYLNYIAIKCWIACAIENTPASLNHLRYGLPLLKNIKLSESALTKESAFVREMGTQLSSLMMDRKHVQHLVHTLRFFVSHAIESGYWGFDEKILFKLSEVKIKSNNQKARVSLLDHENGPFTRSEIADITTAIEDQADIKEKVLVKIAMRYGLRPIQVALLREDDVYYDDNKLAWYINIPRVKGKSAGLRRNQNNFILRELDDELAEDIRALIESDSPLVKLDIDGKTLPRPLFKRNNPDPRYMNSRKLSEFAWHRSADLIYQSFRNIGKKLDIPSRYLIDENGNPCCLKMNCYRFRYTLGTRMVMEGKTPEEVAIALDHSTTSSVQHYFRYNRDLIDFIDDTFQSSASLKNAVARWQGFLIDEHDETIQGSIIRVSEIASLGKCLKSTKCEFHPTVSCYGCSRFRPFKDADHEKQLEIIKGERDFVIAHSSGPVQSQLDEAYEGALHIVEAQKTLKEGRNV